MKISLKNGRIELILALIALLLAVFAALLGEPYRVSENQEEIFIPREINGMKIEYFNTYQIAEWIMEKREDFTIIDVRTLAEFNSYHIPSAQHLTKLNNNLEIHSPDQIIILYAKNNESTIKGWLELKQSGFENVYLMQGGINSWAEETLFPDLSIIHGLEKAMIRKLKKQVFISVVIPNWVNMKEVSLERGIIGRDANEKFLEIFTNYEIYINYLNHCMSFQSKYIQ